jgi:hypothetical protein
VRSGINSSSAPFRLGRICTGRNNPSTHPRFNFHCRRPFTGANTSRFLSSDPSGCMGLPTTKCIQIDFGAQTDRPGLGSPGSKPVPGYERLVVPSAAFWVGVEHPRGCSATPCGGPSALRTAAGLGTSSQTVGKSQTAATLMTAAVQGA